MGLPRDLALQAAAPAIGASHLLLASGKHPAELRIVVAGRRDDRESTNWKKAAYARHL